MKTTAILFPAGTCALQACEEAELRHDAFLPAGLDRLSVCI